MNTAKILQRKAMRASWALKSSKMTDNEVANELRKTSDPFLYTLEWQQLRKQAADPYGFICCKCGR